ncbi:hypothetical protein F6X40_09840 [Paraburkholderia sp. UCT31]|uniref:hypothetical protein n=1 Tax=Paraburkholderia sp. UCT31 TaxID=2615209 RepID=UPI001655E80A|nr:hypothetical protein [Paraburkholderia sp. UCT31]MBC8737109.1 hypothetical protein [Paraburkholderia sp. UCT31]
MRTDFPSTENWLDATAERCARSLVITEQAQKTMLREILADALSQFPQAALDNEFMTDAHAYEALTRRNSMSEKAWALWRAAVKLSRNPDARVQRGYKAPVDSRRLLLLEASLAWYEAASGTTLNEPVRLELSRGRPRDMVVSAVEIFTSPDELDGRAQLTARVYRPPKTSSCQLYSPGDQLFPLDWSDLPASALVDRANGHV